MTNHTGLFRSRLQNGDFSTVPIGVVATDLMDNFRWFMFIPEIQKLPYYFFYSIMVFKSHDLASVYRLQIFGDVS